MLRFVVCPTCDEVYDTPDKVAQLMLNVVHCTNLTCLTDLSDQPIEMVMEAFGSFPVTVKPVLAWP